MRTSTFPALILLAFLASACGESQETDTPERTRIVFGLNPSEKAENVQRNARVLAGLIQRRLGTPVEIFVAQDYSGLVEALRSRNIDFAFLAPLSYVFAERVADARVLLKAERSGRPYYYGTIIVNADSAYRTIADLKGASIAWVDPSSTSGHLFPKAALLEAGIDPGEHFAQQTFAGGHDAVVLSVINGTITAGATYANDTMGQSGSWTQLGEGRYKDKVRPVFYSRPIPGDNLATTQQLIDEEPALVEAVRRAVMELTLDSAGKALMQEMYHVDAMIPATSADYEPVRDAAEALNIDVTGKPKEREGTSNETVSTIVFSVLGLAGLLTLALQTFRERRRHRVVTEPSATSTSPDRTAQISLRELGVTFTDRDGRKFTALKSVSVDIRAGEFIAVIGLSGAGKSTFLRSINRMNEPTAGTVLFEGDDVTHIQGRDLMRLRRRIGFIFQQFNLVRTISVLQNVLNGRLAYVSGVRSLLGIFPGQEVALAKHYLREVGLHEKMLNRADALSGGQQQRVAIARALVQKPRVILADEPMASLDPKLSELILQLLRRFNREEGITVIVNLHVLELARRYADRILAFRAGELAFDGTSESLTPETVERIYHTEAAQIEAM